MKIATHITFFYDKTRIQYLEKVVNNLLDINSKDKNIHIHIYTNHFFYVFNKRNKNIIYHRFGYKKNWRWQFPFDHIINKIGLKCFVHPFYLSWENRKYVEKYIEKYDVQMYIEDDILFTKDTFLYWLENYKNVNKNGYNLGFLRIEYDKNGVSYFSDLWEKPNNIIEIDSKKYIENAVNPYCAFWIYEKDELKEFIKSQEWKFNFVRYNIREKSAIGWHGKDMTRYKGTIIPLILNEKNKLQIDTRCTVHHLPNNYIGHNAFCTIKFPLEY